MDALISLFEGFAHALTPMNLLWVFVGAVNWAYEPTH